MGVPSYTLLHAPLPSVTVLSSVRIDKTVTIQHDQQLSKLNKLRKSFAARRTFWVDVALLDRLHYKSRNQHRHFHRFKRTEELRRLLKRFKTLKLEATLDAIYKTFWNAKTIETCQNQWNFIPSREFAEYTMHRLIATALVLDKAQSVIVDVYRDHTKLLRMEHFLSLSLTYMGLCSRLYVLITNWTYQLEDCYQLLQRWHVAFPYGLKQKELALFMAETHQQCEPMTMQEARRAYVVRENEARSTLEHPLHFASYAAHLSKLPVLENMSSLEPTMMMEEKGKEKDMGVEAMEDMGEIIQRE